MSTNLILVDMLIITSFAGLHLHTIAKETFTYSDCHSWTRSLQAIGGEKHCFYIMPATEDDSGLIPCALLCNSTSLLQTGSLLTETAGWWKSNDFVHPKWMSLACSHVFTFGGLDYRSAFNNYICCIWRLPAHLDIFVNDRWWERRNQPRKGGIPWFIELWAYWSCFLNNAIAVEKQVVTLSKHVCTCVLSCRAIKAFVSCHWGGVLHQSSTIITR